MNLCEAIAKAVKLKRPGVTDGKRKLFFVTNMEDVAGGDVRNRLIACRSRLRSWSDTEMMVYEADFLHKKWKLLR